MIPRVAAVAPSALDAARARAPEGVEILELQADVDPARIEFLVPPAGDHAIVAALRSMPRLEVVQLLSAGTDWLEPHLPPQTILCNARGARDGPVAEWILGALLGASTGLLHCARERRWHKRDLEDLGRWTVVIVGMGSIGRHLAKQLHALGTEVVGVVSQPRDGLHGVDELPRLLPRANAVIVLTPLTATTHGLIGAAELALMRDGALLVNAARGQVLDTGALLAEVAAPRLRAVLDVTDPEPLPDDHPLWGAPGVLAITSHIAGDSAAGHALAAELAGEQLARWAKGEPLCNVVPRLSTAGA